MLVHLLIKNYALIEHLELKPDRHLNIITGETGAGKSILLGAIGLMMGNRADTKTLYNEDEKCIIEGTFDMEGFYIRQIFEEEDLDFEITCLIRREISPSGKSRAFINDTPVTLDTLRRIASELMDIHSQHDTMLLGSNEFQLQIVDIFSQNDAFLQSYSEAYQRYKKQAIAYEKLKKEASESKKEFDYQHFLLDELLKANLQAQEQESLEQELLIVENAEEVKQKLNVAHSCLNNPENAILNQLKGLIASLNSIANLSPDYENLRSRVQSCLIEMKDISSEIETLEENMEVDNDKLEKIQDRLNLIYSLQKKHQVKSNEGLLIIQNLLDEKVNRVLNFEEEIEKSDKLLQQYKASALKAAEILSKKRLENSPKIESLVSELLHDLGIPNAVVELQHTPLSDLTATGFDGIDIRFSANKGIKPQSLKNVASGGEFARLMLVIKYILADKRSLPTIIFDEIDTGISGEIAIKVGEMMLKMANTHQLIAITHLHQIAGKGTSHYFVYKDNSTNKTSSRMKRLTREERILEIAQMIGGQKPSESALKSAAELINF